jgi:hypothetical protein
VDSVSPHPKKVKKLTKKTSSVKKNIVEKFKEVKTKPDAIWQNLLLNSLVAEPEGSTPLISKPAIGHDPEPVPSTSDPQDPPFLA